MNLNNIPVGCDVPHNINVIIEIPIQTYPVKYEVNKKYGVLFVDRFIPVAMMYPCNYGYINNTLSLDGDCLDVLVITQYYIYPGTVIKCRPVGLLTMLDESGKDKKIIAVPCNSITTEYEYIQNITDVSPLLKKQIKHFFQHYKDLEHNKWSKIDNWQDINYAKQEILISIQRFNDKS
ncbi:inorganic diphosphatase [Enterobacteriaceae endosymbiont of Neohaemonia nigricornis]|uniref:inorganic diphosphatase n=1 Tax=Enterobacteriaceae endosymbiont of Neohaemonia nigricornis TaxID=2675792 RepID=UPI0014497DB9|nr:inorganic diphosphatase [Enterobacteriaceae endosymbiont of Neohaemonia nigricornis]QJC30603.1 inorganic diphosphatase [Enterobacteriaceae endosymbiont of Neohaemonia nigricornis]